MFNCQSGGSGIPLLWNSQFSFSPIGFDGMVVFLVYWKKFWLFSNDILVLSRKNKYTHKYEYINHFKQGENAISTQGGGAVTKDEAKEWI